MGLKYTTGEFTGANTSNVTIEHGLGEVPFLFAFVAELESETSGTISGIFMNTGLTTRYTTSVFKNWFNSGTIAIEAENADVAISTPTSVAYGVKSVDAEKITINQNANNHGFIFGKKYHWIAIADWRALTP